MLYAIGEIILVVIGILIAVQINNWNEERKERSTELDYLVRLRSDLAEDTIALDTIIKIHEREIKRISLFLDSIYSQPKTLKDYINVINSSSWWLQDLNLGRVTFNEMSSSGRLDIIKNQQIKTRIIQYYNSGEEGMISIKELNQTAIILFHEVYPYIFKYFSFYPDKPFLYHDEDWAYINDPTSEMFRRLEGTSLHYLMKYHLINGISNDLTKDAKSLLKLISEEINKMQ